MRCKVKGCKNEAANPPDSIIKDMCPFHRKEFGQAMKNFFMENWEEVKLGSHVTTYLLNNPEAETIVKKAFSKTLETISEGKKQ